METIELVIKIPKDIYDMFVKNAETIKANPLSFQTINAVLAGTVLPKGHGRLIDADAINIHDVSPAYGMEVYGVTQDDIEYEPTVIEPDREGKDNG